MNRHFPLILSVAGHIFLCQIAFAQQPEKIFILPSKRATVNLKQLADMEALYPKPAGVYTNFIPNKGIKPAEQNHPVSPFIPANQQAKLPRKGRSILRSVRKKQIARMGLRELPM